MTPLMVLVHGQFVVFVLLYVFSLLNTPYRESLITVMFHLSRHISHGWCESININTIYKASLLILRLIDGTLILPLNFQQ